MGAQKIGTGTKTFKQPAPDWNNTHKYNLQLMVATVHQSCLKPSICLGRMAHNSFDVEFDMDMPLS